MGLSLVTGPTTDPVTLAEAKAHCRVAISDDDGLIAGYILAARSYVETQTHRTMLTQTWECTFDYCWPTRGCYRHIAIPLSPVQSVSSVSYVDENGTTQTLASDQYTVVYNRTNAFIVPAYGVFWPTIRWVPDAIAVRVVAGYTQIPHELRQAILLLVGHFYEHREPVVIGQAPAEVPMSVEALISPFRVVSFG
jgi:uncharacterized phiE125 gp8 family phage protein